MGGVDAVAHCSKPKSVAVRLIDVVNERDWLIGGHSPDAAVDTRGEIHAAVAADPESVAGARCECIDEIVDKSRIGRSHTLWLQFVATVPGVEIRDAQDAVAFGSEPESAAAINKNGAYGARYAAAEVGV